MEDDDDDFYDPADAVPVNQAQDAPQNQSNEQFQEANEGEEEEIEVEEDEVCSHTRFNLSHRLMFCSG